jgi:hypothetical protein
VPVSGAVRLVLELVVLFGGALALFFARYTVSSIVLAMLIVLHYALSMERISWLLQQHPTRSVALLPASPPEAKYGG